MSSEGYKIRRLDQNTELIAKQPPSVEPFPTKTWHEPLPLAVEGRPLPRTETEKGEAKSLQRFYPPLLLFSTILTGVFLFLYLTKPVIVESPSLAPAMMRTVASAEAGSDVGLTPAPVVLSPFPAEASMLSSNELPGFEVPQPTPVSDSPLQQTILGVEKIIEVESLNGEFEKFTVSLSVLYLSLIHI